MVFHELLTPLSWYITIVCCTCTCSFSWWRHFYLYFLTTIYCIYPIIVLLRMRVCSLDKVTFSSVDRCNIIVVIFLYYACASIPLMTSFCGVFFFRFNVNLLVTIALGISAVCIIAIPLCRVFAAMLFLAGIYGACFGATDTFTTFHLLRTYGKQVCRDSKPLTYVISLFGYETSHTYQ